MENFKPNAWDNIQQRVSMAPYTIISKLDPEQLQTLDDWMKGPQVEIYRELDDSSDFALTCRDRDGRPIVTRISDYISINSVRWNLVPGFNIVPKPVAQFIRQMKEDKLDYARHAQAKAKSNFIANY